MTFFGYDLPTLDGYENLFVKYRISPNLLEMFNETKIENVPFDMVKFPYEFVFIELNIALKPSIELCGIIARKSLDAATKEEIDKEYGGDVVDGIAIRPVYRANGKMLCPIVFDITKGGDFVEGANLRWASDGDYEIDEDTATTIAWYCWSLLAAIFIYVTCSDADIILGITTKEYRKLSAKRNPPKAKLEQLRNTRYLGTTIVINRKIEERNTPSKGGSHASPVPHWRTGHFRHLDKGKVVWVRPCIVGYGAGGDKQTPALKKYLLK